MIIKTQQNPGSPKMEKLALTKKPDLAKIADEIEAIPANPKKAGKHVPISIRLEPEVAKFFKESGLGWQTRINQILKNYIHSKKAD